MTATSRNTIGCGSIFLVRVRRPRKFDRRNAVDITPCMSCALDNAADTDLRAGWRARSVAARLCTKPLSGEDSTGSFQPGRDPHENDDGHAEFWCWSYRPRKLAMYAKCSGQIGSVCLFLSV